MHQNRTKFTPVVIKNINMNHDLPFIKVNLQATKLDFLRFILEAATSHSGIDKGGYQLSSWVCHGIKLQ